MLIAFMIYNDLIECRLYIHEMLTGLPQDIATNDSDIETSEYWITVCRSPLG